MKMKKIISVMLSCSLIASIMLGFSTTASALVEGTEYVQDFGTVTTAPTGWAVSGYASVKTTLPAGYPAEVTGSAIGSVATGTGTRAGSAIITPTTLIPGWTQDYADFSFDYYMAGGVNTANIFTMGKSQADSYNVFTNTFFALGNGDGVGARSTLRYYNYDTSSWVSIAGCNAVWLKIKVSVDFVNKKMSFTVNKGDGTLVGSYGPMSFAGTGADGFTKMSLSAFRTNGGSISLNTWVDNFKIQVPNQYAVSFVAKDQNTQVVPNATITIGTQTLTTDATGVANVNLPAGSYTYDVTAPVGYGGTATGQTLTVVDADMTQDITFQVASDSTAYTTSYTVTGLESGQAISPAVTVYTDAAFTNPASATLSAAFNYYYKAELAGYKTTTGTFVIPDGYSADNGNTTVYPVPSFTMAEAVTNLAVNYTVDSTVMATKNIALTDKYIGDSYTFTPNAYGDDSGNFYKATTINSQTVDLTTTTPSVSLASAFEKNVVYFAETEANAFEGGVSTGATASGGSFQRLYLTRYSEYGVGALPVGNYKVVAYTTSDKYLGSAAAATAGNVTVAVNGTPTAVAASGTTPIELPFTVSDDTVANAVKIGSGTDAAFHIDYVTIEEVYAPMESVTVNYKAGDTLVATENVSVASLYIHDDYAITPKAYIKGTDDNMYKNTSLDSLGRVTTSFTGTFTETTISFDVAVEVADNVVAVYESETGTPSNTTWGSGTIVHKTSFSGGTAMTMNAASLNFANTFTVPEDGDYAITVFYEAIAGASDNLRACKVYVDSTEVGAYNLRTTFVPNPVVKRDMVANTDHTLGIEIGPNSWNIDYILIEKRPLAQYVGNDAIIDKVENEVTTYKLRAITKLNDITDVTSFGTYFLKTSDFTNAQSVDLAKSMIVKYDVNVDNTLTYTTGTALAPGATGITTKTLTAGTFSADITDVPETETVVAVSFITRTTGTQYFELFTNANAKAIRDAKLGGNQ